MAVRLRSISIGQFKHEYNNLNDVKKYQTNSRKLEIILLNCFPVRRVGCVDRLDEGLGGVGQVRDHEADEEERDLLLKQNRRTRKPDVILGNLVTCNSALQPNPSDCNSSIGFTLGA